MQLQIRVVFSLKTMAYSWNFSAVKFGKGWTRLCFEIKHLSFSPLPTHWSRRQDKTCTLLLILPQDMSKVLLLCTNIYNYWTKYRQKYQYFRLEDHVISKVTKALFISTRFHSFTKPVQDTSKGHFFSFQNDMCVTFLERSSFRYSSKNQTLIE